MNRRVLRLLRCVHGDRSGAVAVVVGALIFVLVAFSAIVVDLGYLFYAQRSLQASADSAALAGAQDLNVGVGGTASSMAITYSGVSGSKNANPNLTVTMASGYPQLKCFTSTGVSCGGSDSANAIVVKEQATVPLYFARVFGISSWPVGATSTASARGSVPIPLDVMIVLDTTASMNNADTSCGTGMNKIDCALLGIQTLLGGNGSPYGLLPCSQTCGAATNGNVANPIDEVGLMVFPGLTNAAQAPLDYDCNSSAPTIVAYNASPAPTYQVVPLSSDYRISATATTLSLGSNLAKAAAAPGCTPGTQAIGGEGTFYADAITAAQNALATSGRPTVQNVIILLSDGDASAASGKISAGSLNNQCHEAITAAQTATAAGTWVYAIAYQAPTSGSCSTDTPSISACLAMQQIASDATKFYSDALGSGCVSTAHPSYTDLQTIFKDIVFSTTNPRLLPDGTT
jgi:Flp pilus assembly protein TadG